MSAPRTPAVLLDGLGFAEGLRWHDDRLWFSDFVHHHVVSADSDGRTSVEVTLQERPSGLGWLPDGRLLVVAMNSRAVLRREHDGTIVLHADLSHIAASDCNDMVVAADGTAYVGNFGSDLLAGEPLVPADLALVRPDGTVEVAATGLVFANGSVITPDGATLIVGESLARRYRAFTIGENGHLLDGRVWAETPERSPDGCTLDADGAIWFANATRGEVARVLEGGRITDTVELPDTAYACALGGVSGTTLYVATSPSVPLPGLAPGGGRIWTIEADVGHAGRP
ncbi:MAG: SMP-30/gluconolactonase/LRE family protein [Acidimicrobiales bacterium]|nr:SMP-30/gluconolactonase/LRE family protein [Acidimicrobiales bacterium]